MVLKTIPPPSVDSDGGGSCKESRETPLPSTPEPAEEVESHCGSLASWPVRTSVTPQNGVMVCPVLAEGGPSLCASSPLFSPVALAAAFLPVSVP